MKMKVLWFEISTPARYKDNNQTTAGWQDSLENIIRKCSDIKLYIAFEASIESKVKIIDNVTYIPINVKYNYLEKKINNFTWNINKLKLIPECIKIIEQYQPDIIHIFGNEWPFGLIAQYINTPIVIHIQGSIIPYNNALYPPKYNGYTIFKTFLFRPIKLYHYFCNYIKGKSRQKIEEEVWKYVRNYMGRTEWDKALVRTIHPNSRYWHVEEALRKEFTTRDKIWTLPKNKRIQLITTGLSSFWKGPDMLLKTAHLLKNLGIDFEWLVAGNIPKDLKTIIENKEKQKFEHNNIKILGFIGPKELANLLCNSTIYVHTAYIENSPNSICEAQILGVPIISTFVGGIDSLIRNEIDGKLVPANDPWRMASSIIELANNEDKLLTYSKNSREVALKRHSDSNIISELLTCYNNIISTNEC